MKLSLLAIFFISSAAISYEILLIRYLELVQFTELSATIISLALLGFGASGLFASFLNKKISPTKIPQAIIIHACLFSLLSLLILPLIQWIPINPLAIFISKSQYFYLVLQFLLLSLPFFCASTCIILTMTYHKQQVHELYCADLLGAAIGCLAAIALLSLSPVESSFLLPAILAILSSFLYSLKYQEKKMQSLILLSLLCTFFLSGQINLKMSSFKALSKARFLPQVKTIYQDSSPHSLITVLSSPKVPFRHAPGLSLSCPYDLPPQLGVFIDGSSFFSLNEATHTPPPQKEHYSLCLPEAGAYLLQASPQAKSLHLSLTDLSYLNLAQSLSYQQSTIIDPNSTFHQLLSSEQFKANLSPYQDKQRALFIASSLRPYLSSHPQASFELIHLSELGLSSSESAAAISQTYQNLYTQEAFSLYRQRLSKEGLLVISLWRQNPARKLEKILNTLWQAGFSLSSTVQIESIQTSILIASAQPIAKDKLKFLKDKAEAMSFSFSPIHKKEPSSFLEHFNTAPLSDDRPFLHHDTRLASYLSFLLSGEQKKYAYALMDLSYHYLWVCLLIASLLAFIFIILPFTKSFLSQRQSLKPKEPSFSFTAYFSLLGLSFMLLEISFIQKMTLFLEHRVYSLALVLAIFLSFAGLGSLHSLSWYKKLKRRLFHLPFLLIFSYSLILVLLSAYLSEVLLGLSFSFRILIVLALLSPLAYLLGIPFMYALHSLEKQLSSAAISWAWAVNGFFSVVGALATKLLCLHLGFNLTLLLAGCLYLCAAWFLKRI